MAMAAVRVLCDTGPLVGFFNRRDQYHLWAREQFALLADPLITCEAVISEAVFLLESAGVSPDRIFDAVERRQLSVDFIASDHWPDLRRLIRKYADFPMSFADASLVRMSELVPNCQVFTTDRHFRHYRRNGREIIPLLAPF